jgi:hypothetical protein
MYAGDYDNNQSLDLIPTTYYRSEEGDYREYPFYGRKDMEKQIRQFQDIYEEHKEFGVASIEDVLASLPDVTQVQLSANYQLSVVLENLGNGEFSFRELPPEAQLAPVYGILTGDFNGDLLPDLLLTGNDYGNEVGNGRYDALNGLLLTGDGLGNFKPLLMQESGLVIPGDGKSLVRVAHADGSLLMVSGQNQGKLGLFRSSLNFRSIPLEPFDCAAFIHLKDGRSYRQELHYGDSFLSQSGRSLWLPEGVSKVEIENYQGVHRVLAVE